VAEQYGSEFFRFVEAGKQGDQGPMLWFLKYFRRIIWHKIGVFCSKQSQIMQKLDHNIGFW
jgi:hypothetical protein